MSIFHEINEAVEIERVAEYYGTAIRRGKALCPFHADKHPSMSFKHNRFRCWSCGVNGSPIDFVSTLFGLSALEAAKRINEDFNLNFDLKKPASQQAVQKRKETLQMVEAFETWTDWATMVLTDYMHCLKDWERAYTPTPSEFLQGRLHPLYEKALKERDYMNYLLDVLITGKPEDKIEIYRKYQKKVDEIAYQNAAGGKFNGGAVERRTEGINEEKPNPILACL